MVAEVGEPEGVRTIVCDLVRRAFGGGYKAHRLDADPGDAAQALARGLEAGLGSGAASVALKSLAGGRPRDPLVRPTSASSRKRRWPSSTRGE